MLFYSLEQAVPPYTLVPAHPDKPGLAYDMIFRYKTPVAGILRSMPVVPHHPVIIHLKGVLGGRLIIEIDHSILHLQVIMLIYTDGAFINGVILLCKRQRCAPGGYPDGAIIIPAPVEVMVVRIDIMVAVDNRDDVFSKPALHHFFMGLPGKQHIKLIRRTGWIDLFRIGDIQIILLLHDGLVQG